jgi:hypothetical protein
VATAFTGQDVARYTWWTYAAFLTVVFAACVIAVLPGEEPGFSPGMKIGVAAMLFVGGGGAVIGLAAVWVFSPLAWLLGKALEPLRHNLIHAVAFGVQAAVVFTIGTLFDRGDPPLVGQVTLENPAALTLLLASAGTCAFGRWMVFRGRARAGCGRRIRRLAGIAAGCSHPVRAPSTAAQGTGLHDQPEPRRWRSSLRELLQNGDGAVEEGAFVLAEHAYPLAEHLGVADPGRSRALRARRGLRSGGPTR